MTRTLTILFLLIAFAKANAQSLQNDLAFASIKTFSNKTAFENEKASHYSAGLVETWMKERKRSKTVLGYSQQNREVVAYYFPGTSNKKALVIAGVHGSELSAIEVAKQLLQLLSAGEMPYYNLVVIPCLFPDNADKALRLLAKPVSNFGRYSSKESVDPNRQMPPLGKPFLKENPVDMYGRPIERENQFLLQLVQDYQPSRIVNLHAIKDITKAGVYADPRTGCDGLALGFQSDSSLALSMARFIESNGGYVPGNALQQSPTALYYHDPEIAPAGFLQKRNLNGSALANKRGSGVSLGGWASTAVCDDEGKREAARLLTVEFPGYNPSFRYSGEEKTRCALNTRLYALALRLIFAEANYVE